MTLALQDGWSSRHSEAAGTALPAPPDPGALRVRQPVKVQLKILPSPFSDHLSSSHVSSFPLPSLFPPLFFSPPVHCQGGPPRKGRFNKARHRQRLAAAAATTVSGLQITRGSGGTGLPPRRPTHPGHRRCFPGGFLHLTPSHAAPWGIRRSSASPRWPTW